MTVIIRMGVMSGYVIIIALIIDLNDLTISVY